MSGGSRREFFRQCAALAVGSLITIDATRRLRIERRADSSSLHKLAEGELFRGLSLLRVGAEMAFTDSSSLVRKGDLRFRLRTKKGAFRNPEAYSIRMTSDCIEFLAGTEVGLLYSVFDFLQHQGAYFGLGGESYPPEERRSLLTPTEGASWEAQPRFAVRGLLPWSNFLNGITVYNEEDFRSYFEALLRMRLNTFGMHVYSSPESTFAGTESYLSFEFAGSGHASFLDTTATERWGFLPRRTSRYSMGAAEFFSDDVFGSDAMLGRTPWETAENTRNLLRWAFSYAKSLGIATGVGFEPYQLPSAIHRALPPEIKPRAGKAYPGGAQFDVESITARRLLEARLGDLLEAYPDVNYVWLWEDEGMNWESRKTGVPLSLTPFQQAYDFLKRHAPAKRMVVSGWGGVVRHFEYFHERLPKDIIFSCLSDSLGWDPVSDAFSKLEGRERWPIPWIEDDPSMWLPQFHVNRLRDDIDRAERFGCQGILGIHWRNRIVDATAGYLARAAWDSELTAASHFDNYAHSQSVGERAAHLGTLLNETDLHQNLLHTGAEETQGGHMAVRRTMMKVFSSGARAKCP